MATKKKVQDSGIKVQEEKLPVKKEKCVCGSKWVVAGWVLLLLGGLGHMLPEQMGPLLKWSLWGISLQMAIGVVSVILALNFLLED